jgi:hypothetical protein
MRTRGRAPTAGCCNREKEKKMLAPSAWVAVCGRTGETWSSTGSRASKQNMHVTTSSTARELRRPQAHGAPVRRIAAGHT